MNDPWHQETLEGLVATIDATKLGGGTAYAVVVVSSERLGGEVVAELRTRLKGVESLRICTYTDPRDAFQRRLDEPRSGEFRTTIIQGLPSVLESARGEGLLGWLNFRRESFTRPSEAFVFVLTRGAADRWVKEAPDLDRYTSHFGFEDWDDVVETAERAAAKTEIEEEDGETRLKHARERLQQARALGGDFVVGALLEVGDLEQRLGLFVDAERTLAEAWSLATMSHPVVRGKVVLARVNLLLDQGHPDSALQSLRLGEATVVDEVSMGYALGSSYAELRKQAEASSCFQRHPDLASAQTELSEPSRLLFSGDILQLIGYTVNHARQPAHVRSKAYLISLMVWLAQATLEAARPRRAMEIIDEWRMSPGGQSARLRHLVSLRASSRWVLDGPEAVEPIIYEEEQRQRGWTAPVPAAELVYVRGLAASNDDDARRHWQEAASRFRAMDITWHLGEAERRLACLDRLQCELDRATTRIEQLLAIDVREGWRPTEARDRTELAMIALGRRDPMTARDQALQSLDLIRACGTRLYEPAALVALAAAERALGHHDSAASHGARWRRLVRGIDAKGLEAALERDAAWAAAQASS